MGHDEIKKEKNQSGEDDGHRVPFPGRSIELLPAEASFQERKEFHKIAAIRKTKNQDGNDETVEPEQNPVSREKGEDKE